MNYNYLPLDRKWLHFQQVKNLLDYNQQVSITFDAHERILACSEWLDNQSIESNKYLRQIEQSPVQSLTSNLVGIGDEVPIDIVKLMLMLKIKSLSYGYSGVHIETVKRLMEMYNNGVLPVIYPEGAGRGISDSALSQLALPLTGMGQVHFRGKIRKSSKVLEELDWQPVKLSSLEAYALSSGTHFISAYGMFILKKTEQLLKAADVIAALTFNACGYTIKDNDEEIDGLNNNKGGKNTASIIFKFLNSPESAAHNTGINRQPYSFDS
ncbi:MAG: aromatic amino acid lyase, partial [Segetibacter sp.]